jgi:uncharacterized membrane protein YhaH (DUF805 family)
MTLDILGFIAAASLSRGSLGLAIALTILVTAAICLTVVSLARTVRRLHDSGKSGWWLLIGLVPFAGALIILNLTLAASTPGPNRYEP